MSAQAAASAGQTPHHNSRTVSMLRNVVGGFKQKITHHGRKGSQIFHGHIGGSGGSGVAKELKRRPSTRGEVTDTSTRFQKLVNGMRSCVEEMSEMVQEGTEMERQSLRGGSAEKSRPHPDVSLTTNEKFVVSDAKLEQWSCLIYESMSAPSRTFHSVQHVFDISAGSTDPVEIVACFFHDVVYYHVDGGLSAAQEEVIGGIIREEEPLLDESHKGGRTPNKVYLKDLKEDDTMMRMVAAVFGFEGGQELNPFLGLNEFLSAALAARCLEGTVGLARVAEIVACIEMTIPFRKPNKDGKDPAVLLHERLTSTNEAYSLNMTPDELVAATKRAVHVANRDVGNFATSDPAHFLSNTWNLLPESNITLRHTSVFRISNFTLALKKMEGFFSYLDPEVIYVSFEGSPTDSERNDMIEQARRNLNIALKYMRCKLLSISVLAALAELTGGDAPVAMFLGDLPEPGYVSPSIEDVIVPPSFQEAKKAMEAKGEGEKKGGGDGPEADGDLKGSSEHSATAEGGTDKDGSSHGSPAAAAANDADPKNNTIDETVYDLLTCGRETESSFDLKHSPLAAFLYSLMGDKGLEASLQYAVFPMTQDGARKLLGCIPRKAVWKIATACANIALTRAKKLKEIAEEYKD